MTERRFAMTTAAAALLWAGAAHAQTTPTPTPPSPVTTPAPATAPPVTPAPRRDGFTVWPVRVHLALPLGSTWGRERVNGFSWGFRAALQVYPTRGWRGLGVGAFAETLLDAQTHSHETFGALATFPLASWSWGALRAGGTAGVRWVGEGAATRPVAAAGAQLELAVPAYLYDLSLGVRLDTTLDDTGFTAASLLVDVDLAVLLAAVAAAGAIR